MYSYPICVPPGNPKNLPVGSGTNPLTVPNVPLNKAIVAYEKDAQGDFANVVENSKELYRLTNQAYYIIELGHGDPDDNYFIVITERANPIVVWAKKYENIGYMSFLLSKYEGVTGKQLIDSNFRMTVRNHLGKLVITFSGFEGKPWIIEKTDIIGRENNGDLKIRPKIMYVPGSTIRLYSGNMLSSFSFSPLQYVKNCAFNYPPSGTMSVETDQKISIRLTSSAASDDNSLPAFSLSNSTKVFTQDAQKITEIVDEVPVSSNPNFFDLGTPLKFPGSITGGADSEILLTYRNASIGSTTTSSSSSAVPTKIFTTAINLNAGDHFFSIPPNSINGKAFNLESCNTPVLTQIRIFAPESTNPLWNASTLDVTNHTVHYSDNWSSQDYNKIEHTGAIKFILSPVGDGSPPGNFPFPGGDKSQALFDLQKSAFYITVDAFYFLPNNPTVSLSSAFAAPGITDSVNTTGQAGLPGTCLIGDPPAQYFSRLFTGLCYGGKITVASGMRHMECKIYDYSKILETMYFLNSPFFDGMNDVYAARHILRMAGFNKKILNIVNQFCNQFSSADQLVIDRGRYLRSFNYALPLSYDRIQQPMFKFKDGDKYYDALLQIAQRGSKLMYFDNYGTFHFEAIPDQPSVFGANNGVITVNPIRFYTTDPANFPERQLAVVSIDIERDVESVYNDIQIISSTPNYEVIIAGDTNYPSLLSPGSEGFLGYKRQLLQMDGIFGSLDALQMLVNHYGKFYRPPQVIRFESYGYPLRALDVIDIDGNPLRINSISNEIDPQENKWWQTIDGEWLYESKNIFNTSSSSSSGP